MFLDRVKHDAGAEQVFEKKTPNDNKRSDAASGNCVISTHMRKLKRALSSEELQSRVKTLCGFVTAGPS